MHCPPFSVSQARRSKRPPDQLRKEHGLCHLSIMGLRCHDVHLKAGPTEHILRLLKDFARSAYGAENQAMPIQTSSVAVRPEERMASNGSDASGKK